MLPENLNQTLDEMLATITALEKSIRDDNPGGYPAGKFNGLTNRNRQEIHRIADDFHTAERILSGARERVYLIAQEEAERWLLKK